MSVRTFMGLALLSAAALSCFFVPSSSAMALKVAPLEYKTDLKKGEKKSGFIDVSNPTSQAVNVTVSVQAFKQIDDNGGLQFYPEEQIAEGVTTDLKKLELGPREAVRMSFTIDGNKLPQGDVFGAIFFTTEPTQPKNGMGQQVRVGTLLSVVNTTPGYRSAAVVAASVALVQLSSNLQGSYVIKNTGKSGGFYPEVVISSWPSGEKKTIKGSLVFAGRERQNDFNFDAGYGVHRIEIGYEDSKKTTWAIAVAPWMLVLFAMIVLVVAIEILLLHKRRRSTPRSDSK